jgi:hypothetical protein
MTVDFEATLSLTKHHLREILECIKVFEEGDWNGVDEVKMMGNIKQLELYFKAIDKYYMEIVEK